MTRDYRVTYTIDVNAETAEEAARIVAAILRDPSSLAPVLEIDGALYDTEEI